MDHSQPCERFSLEAVLKRSVDDVMHLENRTLTVEYKVAAMLNAFRCGVVSSGVRAHSRLCVCVVCVCLPGILRSQSALLSAIFNVPVTKIIRCGLCLLLPASGNIFFSNTNNNMQQRALDRGLGGVRQRLTV